LDLKFDEPHRTLWPAIRILRAGKHKKDIGALLEGVGDWLKISQFSSPDLRVPGDISALATEKEVTDWLFSVWNALSGTDVPTRFKKRRSLVKSIVDSDLSPELQERLVSALDYLFRLAQVPQTPAVQERPAPEVPRTKNSVMQAAYRKLAGLAVTDLPIWLCGEKGCEIDELVYYTHRVRELSGRDLHVLDFARPGADSRSLERAFADIVDHSSDGTVLMKNVDHASDSMQASLHDYLMSELTRPGPVRIVVSSQIPVPGHALPQGVFPELFAFLGPMKIELPPLRSRTEDLEALMTFLTQAKGVPDCLPRMTQETLEVLRRHPWPGNCAELEVMMGYLAQRRPRGDIRPEHLPDTVVKRENTGTDLLEQLADIREQHGFRILASESDRSKMSEFLEDPATESFTALDFQKTFNLSRETSRRLLRVFIETGIVEGKTGSGGKRVTRYIRKIYFKKDV
jgi:hypothetical protein